jgi:5-methylcytosine-specific restriction endonuclease McrA
VSESIKKIVAKRKNDDTQWWFSGNIKCPKTDWIAIFQNLNYHCVYCGECLESTAEKLVAAKLDHIVPPIAFGDGESPNHENNLVPCCSICYAIKDGIAVDASYREKWKTRKTYIATFRTFIKEARPLIMADIDQYVDNAIIYPWDSSPQYKDLVD